MLASLFTQAAKEASSSIPIVFIAHADAVGTGHVASLAKPGGNLTGLALLQTELGTKGLELLSAVVPGAQRIAVLWHWGTPSHTPGLRALEEAGRSLPVELQPVGVRTGVELDRGHPVAYKHVRAFLVGWRANPRAVRSIDRESTTLRPDEWQAIHDCQTAAWRDNDRP